MAAGPLCETRWQLYLIQNMSEQRKTSVVALVPARAGSLRVANKNVRLLHGHPLMAYSIAAAIESQIFDAIIVSTDAEEYAEIAREYGAEAPFLRPRELAKSNSPDIEWISYTLKALRDENRNFDAFCILRPTSPFRQSETIVRAWQTFLAHPEADSLRAVEKCQQHPGKMWVIQDEIMSPLLPFHNGAVPWHSSGYQTLPEIYVQNASLEIAWSRVIFSKATISGNIIVPLISIGYEGFDINDENDWVVAQVLLSRGLARLPNIGASKVSMEP
jgi:N-acylneuraminate cytidylyltransferase